MLYLQTNDTCMNDNLQLVYSNNGYKWTKNDGNECTNHKSMRIVSESLPGILVLSYLGRRFARYNVTEA